MNYKGFDILDLAFPVESAERQRRLSISESVSGTRHIVDKEGVSRVVRKLVWEADGAAEQAALDAFIEARAGAHAALWVPSGQHDMTVGKEVRAGDDTIELTSDAYGKRLYGLSAVRRHVCLLDARGTVRWAAGVVSCTTNPLTRRDTIRVSSQPPAMQPGDGLTFLTLSRLAGDEVELVYTSPTSVSAELSFIELPRETPDP